MCVWERGRGGICRPLAKPLPFCALSFGAGLESERDAAIASAREIATVSILGEA